MMILLAFLLVIQVTLSSGTVVFSLNGDDWTLSGPNNISVGAKVPGGVYTDLLRNKKIDDPYFRMNDLSLRWVAMANWTYTKIFNVDDAFLRHNHIDLVAGGLDTIASVYLNDILILQADNMFRRYVKEVKAVLKNGQNVIRVVFFSPVTYAEDQAKNSPYNIPPDCPPPVQNGECHFNFIRKEACSFSWDWGPSFPSMGIWRNITLEAYEGSVLRYVETETRFERGLWTLRFILIVHVNISSSPLDGVATIEIPEIDLTYQHRVPLLIGTIEEIITIPLSQVVEPWWPNGLGPQKLYETVVTLNNSLGDVDQRRVFVGFRTVELVEDIVGGEESGYTFYFKINGIPVFIKGSNWIPADSFQERITPAYLERLLISAVEANMNMLRVWGGGVYESEEFYALTDRLGIMIWQDFMFACALYPADEKFLANVREEVIHQVHRLKRHPSIVLWSGNNENEGALSQNWFNIPSSEFERYRADYVKLYIDTIGNYITYYADDTRPFVPSSPSNGRETLQEGYVAKDPQSVRYGDIHYYTYENDTWNWKTFPMPRFASEFGIQSWCSMETLAPVSLPVDWDLSSDFVLHRQHHDSGNEQIQDEIAMHMNLPDAVNRTQRFIDFIYLSQTNQAVGIKTEVEFYRRSQNLMSDGKGLTMGALYWQLNDIWQGPTWASIEYGGKWKMLHYYAKRFYSRTLVSPYIEDGLVKVYYINDDVLMKYPHLQHEDLMHGSNKTLKFKTGEGQEVDEQSQKIYEDVVLMRKGRSEEEAEVVLRITCYHWNSLDEQMSWKISFQKPTLASKCVHMSRLSEMMRECNCPHPSHCFLYFSGDFPDNHLFLTNLSSVVGLEKASVQVAQVDAFNSTSAKIILTTDHISPFTWLEVEGFPGRFSDNGFLMVSEVQVMFYSWDPVDWNKFTRALTVRTFLDVYNS